jgi:hypothetical protein
MDDPAIQSNALLRSLIQPGDTVFCVERPSATYNYVEVHVVKDSEVLAIGYYVSLVLGSTYDRRVKGIRMEKFYNDPSAQIVMELNKALFGGDNEPIRHRVL